MKRRPPARPRGGPTAFLLFRCGLARHYLVGMFASARRDCAALLAGGRRRKRAAHRHHLRDDSPARPRARCHVQGRPGGRAAPASHPRPGIDQRAARGDHDPRRHGLVILSAGADRRAPEGHRLDGQPRTGWLSRRGACCTRTVAEGQGRRGAVVGRPGGGVARAHRTGRPRRRRHSVSDRWAVFDADPGDRRRAAAAAGRADARGDRSKRTTWISTATWTGH